MPHVLDLPGEVGAKAEHLSGTLPFPPGEGGPCPRPAHAPKPHLQIRHVAKHVCILLSHHG